MDSMMQYMMQDPVYAAKISLRISNLSIRSHFIFLVNYQIYFAKRSVIQ